MKYPTLSDAAHHVSFEQMNVGLKWKHLEEAVTLSV